MFEKKEPSNVVLILVFFFVIGCMPIYYLFHQDISFSDTENRSLQGKPSFSLSSFLRGTYQTEQKKYYEDQFIKRDTLVRLRSTGEVLLQKKELHDVYVGKENTLMEGTYVPTKASLQNKEKALKQFTEENPSLTFTFLLIPTKIGLYKNLLPSHALEEDQTSYITTFYQSLPDTVKKIDAVKILKQHQKENLYYKTDHHWTSLGAKYVYEAYVKQVLKEEVPSYQTYIANTSFYGSLSKKTGLYQTADTVSFYVNEKIKNTVNYVQEKKIVTSLFDKSKQYSSDPYTIFLGGNYARIDINTNVANQKHLLLLKDSYANAMLPMLVSHFASITVIDPRYYYDNLEKVIQEREITDVLFLYNANTFFEQSTLEELLREKNT